MANCTDPKCNGTISKKHIILKDPINGFDVTYPCDKCGKLHNGGDTPIFKDGFYFYFRNGKFEKEPKEE